ncbi:uncharacterized protein LOC126563561 [Anopheles maculipalpis]|uniref:uncharacterized protein LOC126563561 n=1 Tax=Anopheles maculipalpis TaxID=1496333 RepID=UPI002158F471|nr:uncharacterized protein LOC126563561 [Anopheles maculipalpis]
MGDDVICIDSDDDEEDEAVFPPAAAAAVAGSAFNARAAFGRHGGRHWRQRRRAQRARKYDSTILSNNTSPLAKLLDGLRSLSSEMYFGEWAGKSGPDFPFHSLAQRVRSLVAEFQRHDTAGPLTMAARTEGWRQVVRFLVLLRTIGLTEVLPNGADDDPGCDKHRREDDKQSIEDVNWLRTSHKSKVSHRAEPGHLSTTVCCSRVQARQTRRYQLTVIDILADYIRFRCESVALLHPPIRPAALLRECNRIVGSMFVIFDGSVELMTLTLLRLIPDRSTHTLLLYPVFENILTSGTARNDYDTIPGYVRMLLCFKRWKSLVSGRTEKASIDAHAIRLLPGRCPTVQRASDLSFLRLLPTVPPGQRVAETRYLLVNDLFSLEHCIAQYFRHHRRTLTGLPVDESARKQGADRNNSIRQRRLVSQHSMEIRSNYINVPLLAELIERKSQHWTRAITTPPAMLSYHRHHCLEQEVHSIIESLRLIFRNRAEFIELTLLRVKTHPSCVTLLGPVFATFLGTAAAASPTSNTTTTGLTIYRSNDVETYGRLMLCYAKWKSLYWTADCGRDEPAEWASIDAVALTQLPYDFPRPICPRDARLRRIFPSGLAWPNGDVGAGVLKPTTDGKRNNVTTRILLRALPKRSDLQELCLQFIQAYRCGSDAATTTPPSMHDQQDARSHTTNSAAYKSTSPSSERSLRWHSSDAVSGQPTFQAHNQHTEQQSEMKPIIILDSDDPDETSSNAQHTMPAKENEHTITAQNLLHSDTSASHPTLLVLRPMEASVAKNDTCTANGMDQNSSSTPSTDEFVTDTAVPQQHPAWPPFAECFLNTPPATPQHETPPEVVDEEHRRAVLVKKPFPSSSWTRLKGTIRLIGRRKKRISAAGIVKRVLGKFFAHDGWWNFADVLAAKLHSSTSARCSSIMSVGLAGNCMLKLNETVTTGTVPELLPNGQPDATDRGTVSGGRLAPGKDDDDRSKNDALLRELIDCLGAVDTMPLESKQGYVDFAILPDNPGYGAERNHTDTVDDHQASPSVHGGCVDTSPLFAADSDKYVLLFTELGLVSWPIV